MAIEIRENAWYNFPFFLIDGPPRYLVAYLLLLPVMWVVALGMGLVAAIFVPFLFSFIIASRFWVALWHARVHYSFSGNFKAAWKWASVEADGGLTVALNEIPESLYRAWWRRQKDVEWEYVDLGDRPIGRVLNVIDWFLVAILNVVAFSIPLSILVSSLISGDVASNVYDLFFSLAPLVLIRSFTYQAMQNGTLLGVALLMELRRQEIVPLETMLQEVQERYLKPQLPLGPQVVFTGDAEKVENEKVENEKVDALDDAG